MKTLKKLFGFSLGPVLGAVLSTISVPIATHFLLPNEYGKTSMFNLMYTILVMVAYLGYDQAFIREYHENENKSKVLLNSMIVPIGITILLMLCVVPFSAQISYFLFGSENHKDVVYLFALTLPFLLIERFILVNLRMQEKALEYSLFTLLVKVVSFCCTLFFLFNIRQDFLAIVYSTIIAHYIGDGFLIIRYRKMLKFRIEDMDTELIKRMTKYAMPLVPATVIGSIFNGEDKVFIKAFSDYSELGYYQVSMTIANMILILQQAFSTFWTPTVFRWKKENVPEEQYEMVQKIVMFFSAICFMGILLLKNLFPILFSTKYENTKYILPFLLFYPVMSMVISTTVSGIDFARKTQYTLYFSIAVTIINFILNWLLVPLMGAVGAAIATGVSHVFYFWIRTLYSRKLWFDFELKHLFFSTILLSIAATVNSISNLSGWLVYGTDIIIIILGICVYRNLIVDIYNNYIKEIIRKKLKI
ncbi:lipopolysaccharide biosynthesis protein [Lachnospiraceae bacterium SGI.085]